MVSPLHKQPGDEAGAGFTSEVSRAAGAQRHQSDAKEISSDTAAANLAALQQKILNI